MPRPKPAAPAQENQATSPAANRRTPWLAAAVLVVLTLAVYANSFSGPFVFDDVTSIPENPSIRHLGRIADVLNPPATGGMTVGGRPVLNLSFALNYAVSGTDVWSYHALNIVIHLLAGLTLFGIVRRTLGLFFPVGRGLRSAPDNSEPDGGERLARRSLGEGGNRRPTGSPHDPIPATSLALVVALLWMLHPLQTEAVTYIVQRAESLMGLFYLQTLYAFIRAVEAPNSRAWPVWCFGACLLGMATKEVMVSAPLLVLLYDRTFFAGTFREAWRLRRRLYVALCTTWIPLALLVASHGGTRGGSIGFGGRVGWWEHGLTQFRAICRYLWLSFWPHPLVFDYGAERISGAMDVLPYVVPVGLLLWLTWRGLRRRTSWGFVGVWFLAILAPTSIIPGPTQMTVEHRMYLPLAVVLSVAVIGAYRLAGRKVLLVGVAGITGFAGLTFARNRDYRTELSLWGDTLQKRPTNPVASGGYGMALTNANRLTEALAVLEPAAQSHPDDWLVLNNLGTVLAKMERFPEAVAAYARSVQASPDRTNLRENLARSLARLGRFDEAVVQYRSVLAARPDSASAQAGLGTCLMLLDRAPDAIDHFRAALRIEPNDAESELNLGNALALTGQPAEAVSHFETALRLQPDYTDAACNLADALFLLHRPADAVARYEATIVIQPGNAEVHARFGVLLARLGRLPEARLQLTEALRIDPNHELARQALLRL